MSAVAVTLDEVLSHAGAVQGLRPGRKAKPLEVNFLREVEERDLLEVVTAEAGIQAKPIAALRQSHHQLARLLATGKMSETEIASITGYSLSRISILKSDPTFQETLSYYRAMEAEQYETATADMKVRLAALGFDAIETLHERLLDSPDTFDLKRLQEIVELVSDRTGYGKQSTVNQNVQHGLSPATLAAIRGGGAPDDLRAAPDREALLRLATERTAQVHTEVSSSDCIESEGALVREEGGEGAEEPAARQGDGPSVVRVL